MYLEEMKLQQPGSVVPPSPDFATSKPPYLNVFVKTAPGLGLPSTLCFCASHDDLISNLFERIRDVIPGGNTEAGRSSYCLTYGRLSTSLLVDPEDGCLVSSIISPDTPHATLSLSYKLCGGKGGFGSQLRAAGGRMSSKRKKNQGDSNGSSRNLDGRRIRTINEAKSLAEYLAIKPDMEKKEKEKRKRRWQQIVDTAEQREHEMRTGSKAQLDGKWVEDKEEAGEKMREAVLAAMKTGNYRDNVLGTSLGSATTPDESGSDEYEVVEKDGAESSGSSKPSSPQVEPAKSSPAPRKFFGFEDDDFMSSSDEEDSDSGREEEDN